MSPFAPGAALGLLLVASAACSTGGDRQGALQSLADAVRAEVEAPGAILGLRLPDGEVLVAASGVSDRGATRPLRPEDGFFLGSVSKIYTAVAVLKLVEDGRLRVDEPLSAHLPEVPRAEDLRVDHLLRHTSGLRDFYSYLYFRPDREEMIELVTRDWHPDEVFALIRRFGFSFEPGSEWSYSNTNYWLLGVLIERVTGRPLAEAQRELVLDPLGLDETWLALHEPARASLDITGHMGTVDGWAHSEMFGDLGPTTIIDRSPIEWGAGGMAATASDAVSFLSDMMDGRLLAPPTVAGMTTFTDTPALGLDSRLASPSSGPDGYGRGLVRMQRPGHSLVGHGGLFAGHTSGVWYVRDCGLTVSLYFNRGFVGQRAAIDRILDAVPAIFPSLAPCGRAEDDDSDR